jgi:pyocin large subunit-like protein
MTVRRASWLSAFAMVGLAMSVAACDGGASAVKAPKAGDVASAAQPASDRDAPSFNGDGASSRPDPRDAPVRKVAGKPMWAANRTRTAEENAQRGFERYGAEFAAADVDDYVRKAHAFVGHPPAGVQTLTRANGDTLIYDPKDNVFAVVTKAGAPAHHVQARRRRDLLGDAEGGSEPANHGVARQTSRDPASDS